MKASICVAIEKMGLLLFAIFFSLLFAELTARLISRPISSPTTSNKVLIHEASQNLSLLYKPIPNAESFVYHVDNKINSQGFRDREFEVEKKNATRILFLGDSVVYGYALNLDQTLPKQVETLFQKKNKSVEILNFGVSGYETEQEIEFFKENGLRFKPDFVLVGYTLNDSNYASWELDQFHVLTQASVQRTAKKIKKKILGRIFQHSRLAQILDNRLGLQRRYKIFRSYYETSIYDYLVERNTIHQDAPDSDYRLLDRKITDEAHQLGTSEQSLQFLRGILGFQSDPVHSSHWNISYQKFQELKTLSEQNGFKIGVVIFPIFQEMDKYCLDSVHAYIKKQIEGLGIPVLDLGPWGKRLYAEQGRPNVSPDSIHMTSLAAESASREIYQWLSQQELLSQS